MLARLLPVVLLACMSLALSAAGRAEDGRTLAQLEQQAESWAGALDGIRELLDMPKPDRERLAVLRFRVETVHGEAAQARSEASARAESLRAVLRNACHEDLQGQHLHEGD